MSEATAICAAFEAWERGNRKNIWKDPKHAVLFTGADKRNALKALEENKIITKITVGMRDSGELQIAQAKCLVDRLAEGVYVGMPKGRIEVRRGDVTVMWDSEIFESPGLGVVYRVDFVPYQGWEGHRYHRGRLFIFWLKVPIRRSHGRSGSFTICNRCTSFTANTKWGYARLFNDGILSIGKMSETVYRHRRPSAFEFFQYDPPRVLEMMKKCSTLSILVDKGWKLSAVDQIRSGLGFEDGMKLILIAEEMIASEMCTEVIDAVLEAGVDVALRSFRHYTHEEAQIIPLDTPIGRFGRILRCTQNAKFGLWPMLRNKIADALSQYFSVEDGQCVIRLSGVEGWTHVDDDKGWRYYGMEEQNEIVSMATLSMACRERSICLTEECIGCILAKYAKKDVPNVLRRELQQLKTMLIHNLRTLESKLKRHNFLFETMKPTASSKRLKIKGKRMVREIFECWEKSSCILVNFSKTHYRRWYSLFRQWSTATSSVLWKSVALHWIGGVAPNTSVTAPWNGTADSSTSWLGDRGEDCYKRPPKKSCLKPTWKRKRSRSEARVP